ncbi:plasma-membrane choline transporter-domain-containing protein [Fomitopsis serialis]|uniref:plasma-membrane choline transporter-domain-containing protein n=1 Tax=Fomitopsis serialis TaxID=139415 RepID=UPI0020080B4A|nr:plasma-membrane choline transporter-domain-containing protein [Neoantrodia serialis]KAH9917426.1 plasma-membrane choline transporter-domain-containing protein [Neoantrodia serialis]
MSRGPMRGGRSRADEEDDDPYLRLDEEDAGLSRHQAQSVPLLGWLAHASPLRSPSPSPSSSSADSGHPPPDIMAATTRPPVRTERLPPPPPPPPRAEVTLSLTESLLPRDGRTRPLDVFTLPDPRFVPRSRRKYNDSTWTAAWCASVGICLFFSILVLFLTHQPDNRHRVILPYVTLLHTVPLLTILIFASACVAYAHVLLLRIFVKPVMIATSVFIPATLFISAIWAFVGSFMWDGTQEPTWGETVGLRLFSLVPLVLSLLTARKLLDLPRDIHTASSLLTLTTRLLIANPFLLALSPAVLLAALLLSIPFITLAFRLLLIGYFTQASSTSGFEWHVRGWANWAIVATIGVWLWSWGVARGLLRVSCAATVGAWYYADPALPLPPPTSTHTIHAAITRATQPSLGSIVLSALILAGIRLLGLLTAGLRMLPYYLPPYLRFMSVGASMLVGYMETITGTLSKYALIYVGLTGDPFFPSARRSRALTATVEHTSAINYRRRFKTEPPLTLLTVAPLTLTFPFALGTYLFVAHTLNAPDQALSAAMLAGCITALVGSFCVGLVRDTADTLYICYCIDKDIGSRRRDEVFEAFEYQSPRRAQPAQSQRQQQRMPEPQQPRIRLEPAVQSPLPRAETPDPFEQSPAEEEEHSYPDPMSPSSSTFNSKSRLPLSRRTSMLDPVLSTTLPPHQESDEESLDDEDMPLFPGSDLF